MTDDGVLFALRFAEGPLFRFSLALALLGLLRILLLEISDVVGAYVTITNPQAFWRRVMTRILWTLLPSRVLLREGMLGGGAAAAWHLALDVISLIFRVGVVLVPTFMVAHVYLWERALGVSWPSFGYATADLLSWMTVGAAVVLLLGRVYSPVLRGIEPGWTFLRPLLLLAAFLTGLFSAHPTWTAVDYHVMLLLHVLSASLCLALLPFARLLSNMFTPLSEVLPHLAWRPAEDDRSEAAPPGVGHTAGERLGLR